MRHRMLAVTAIVALAATAAPATAERGKVRPVHLGCAVRDAAGDVQSPDFDIRSVQAGVGERTVVVVLQLGATHSQDAAGTAERTLGATWRVTFMVGKVEYAVDRRRAAGLNDRYTYSFSGRGGIVSAAESRDEVRWEVARSALPGIRGRCPLQLAAETTGAVSRDTTDSSKARS